VETGALAALQKNDIDLFSHQKAWRGNRIFFGGRRGGIDALWTVTISERDMHVSRQPHQVTPGEARERDPSFSATGAIAFGRLSGALHVWRISFDARGGPGRASKVTDDPSQDCCPAASRDGQGLFFTRRIHNVRELYRKDLATGVESVLLSSTEDDFWPVPNWNGDKVAFESRRGNRSTIELIAQNHMKRTLCVGCFHPTSWFGGDEAIFHTSSKGEIALLDTDTGLSRTVLTGPNGMLLADADWCPDNEYLLFTATANGGATQVYAVRFPRSTGSAEGRWILLTPDSNGVERPRWSSDGKMFYYLSKQDGYLCVWGLRFTPGEKNSLEKPFPVMHYHNYPRISPNRTTPRARGLSVAGGSIFLNVGEATETIWTGVLTNPSWTSIFR
jgi:Tol biopolymer transport system component